MSDKKSSGTNLTEDDIVELLSSLRRDPQPEANFEDRFVHDFRDRVARYAVTKPARKVLWEHILLRLTSIGKVKWACGATTLGVGLLAAGFLSWPSEDAEQAERIAPAIGSARVVSRDALDTQNQMPAVVSASLELESSTCLLPLPQDSFFGGNKSISPYYEPARSAVPLFSAEGMSSRVDPMYIPVKPARQITLPAGQPDAVLRPFAL